MNQMVEEGGDATFSCSGTVDGFIEPTRYAIRRGMTVIQTVGGNISDLVAMTGIMDLGIDAALVFGDFGSQLLLRNMTRKANSYTVSCVIIVGAILQ